MKLFQNDTITWTWKAILCLLLALGCGDEPPAKREPALRPVRYVRVSGSAGPTVRAFAGTARAAVASVLSFKVGGTIEEVLVAVGDRADRGDLIARLDPADFALRVQEAEASLARAEAEARNAAAAYERIRALYENRNASRNDLDAARAAAESSKAAVRSIRKQLALARRQLGYTRLAVPRDDCAVAAVAVEENENVGPGQPVATVTCGDRIEVRVAVPEGIISRLREGEPATVVFDALPDRRFDAVTTEVGVSATGAETTFPVTVALAEPRPEIRPGMAAEVRFAVEQGDAEKRIMVPTVAVGEDRDGRFVYTVTPSEDGTGVVHRRPVTVGEITPEGLAIESGLSDGDLLVTAGISRLDEGRRVKLTEK